MGPKLGSRQSTPEKHQYNILYYSDLDNGKRWYDSIKTSQYTSFINYARSNGMRVYAVTLEDPKYVLMSDEELRKAFGSFITKTRDVFDTYVIDVEPRDSIQDKKQLKTYVYAINKGRESISERASAVPHCTFLLLDLYKTATILED
jgi:hypothetical protein